MEIIGIFQLNRHGPIWAIRNNENQNEFSQ